MKPRTIPLSHAIDALEDEVIYTRSLLLAYDFLAARVPAWDALYAGWEQLATVERALRRERVESEARVVAVDETLDRLCTNIASQLLVESGHNRKAPEYLRYFGQLSPSQLKRPVLGNQLDTMRTWIPSLRAPDSSPTLQGYGQSLTERVAEADAAETALAESRRKRKDHHIGMRQDYINQLNVTRVDLYGYLAGLPLAEPERTLPNDFGHKFFLRSKSRSTPTIDEMSQRVLQTREKLERQETELARLIAERDAREQMLRNAEIRAAQDAVNAAERTHAEAEARLAALLADHSDDDGEPEPEPEPGDAGE